jgi:glutathione synthase/RimK-type ligase-like ATP-grasp enzyme
MSKTIGIIYSSPQLNLEGKPFSEKQYNNHYKAYAEASYEKNVEVVLGRPSWYENGSLKKAWVYDDGWNLEEDKKLDGAFDKFRADGNKLKQKIHSEVGLMNNPELSRLFRDKLETYRAFPEKIPETVEGTYENVSEFLERYGKAVVKPRYDYGGRGVKVIDELEKYNYEEDIIAQRFIESGSPPGYDSDKVHDLRLILINGEVVSAYLRMPNDGLIANVNQGGAMEFVDISEVPSEFREIASDVAKKFEEYSPSIYCIDFIVDREGNAWVIELNSKPGIGDEKEEVESQYEIKAIEKLVEAFKHI